MSEAAAYPLLTILLALPLLGALLAALVRRAPWAPVIALASALLTLLASLLIVAAFDPADPGFQLLDSAPWIPGLNIRYLVGVDGVSLLFLPATALLFCAAVVAGWRVRAAASQIAPGVYFALLLLLEAATLGIFCALDTILFFACWEFTLLPLYFLVSLWGVGAGRQPAAVRYFLVMLAGGVPLLFGLLAAAFGHASGGAPVFDLPTLLATPLPVSTQYVVFLLLLLGFGVKVPLVPLHTWLPQFSLAAPGSLTALLVGLKLGAFGLIRFAVPLAPQAALDLHWLLAGLGTVAILYGAVGMLAQSNLRVALAYASICHVGLAVLGLASYTAQGAQGAVSLLLSFSVATGGAFVLLEFLRQRTGSTDIHALGGAAKTMPMLATGFLICGLAGVGMPGTSSFPGEFMLIIAALHSHTGAGMAALFGLAIAAGSFLALYRQAFFGPVERETVAQASDLRPREWLVVVAIIVMIVGIGVYPGPWIEVVRPASEAWAAGLGR